jgi:hypothetical protein
MLYYRRVLHNAANAHLMLERDGCAMNRKLADALQPALLLARSVGLFDETSRADRLCVSGDVAP